MMLEALVALEVVLDRGISFTASDGMESIFPSIF